MPTRRERVLRTMQGEPVEWLLALWRCRKYPRA